MNAPFPRRVLRGYQEKATTYLYEHDSALLVAKLGADKGAAALTALAELVGRADGTVYRPGQTRHVTCMSAS